MELVQTAKDIKLHSVKIWRCFVQQEQSYGSKYKRTERSRSHVKVIRKGHRFVKSDLRLVLLNKEKKFEDDAIARFCCSALWLHRWKQKKKPTETGSITILTDSTSRSIEYLSVNNKINPSESLIAIYPNFIIPGKQEYLDSSTDLLVVTLTARALKKLVLITFSNAHGMIQWLVSVVCQCSQEVWSMLQWLLLVTIM